MNDNFNTFTTINLDSSVNKTKVTAYIADKILNQNDTDNKKGKLVIVDNTNERYPIAKLLSEYGFFIDDIFISGGHGFKTYEEAKKVLDTVNGFDAIYQSLLKNLDELNNKTFIVSIGEDNTDDTNRYDTYLDEKFNEFGFITSYKYLEAVKLNNKTEETTPGTEGEEITEGNTVVKNIIEFQIYIREQTNIEYIDSIEITPVKKFVEITSLNAANIETFSVKYTIKMNNVGSKLPYNNDLKVYLRNSNDEIFQINTQYVSQYEGTCQFNKPTNKFEDNLELFIVNGNDEIVYSKIFSNILKWKDKFTYCTNNSVNSYNFRDSADFNGIPEITSFINNQFTNAVLEEIEYNQEISLDFENDTNESSYDYVIFRNNYDVEFYFNGIKSNNWVVQQIGEYFVWQSPQQYIGLHTWKLIIKS